MIIDHGAPVGVSTARPPLSARCVAFVVLLWVACAWGLAITEGIPLALLGVPPLSGQVGAGAVRVTTAVVFILLGGLGTRRLLSGRGSGGTLMAISQVPVATGILAAVVALFRLAPTAPITTADSVAWQMVLEAACVPATRGLSASACALMVVLVESACAYWAGLGAARAAAGGASTSVGRGIASGCAHAVVLLLLLPVLLSTESGFMEEITRTAHAWACLVAGVTLTAAIAAIPQAMRGAWLGWVRDADVRAALWSRAVVVPVSAALAILFFELAASFSSLRPFKPLPLAIGSGDSNDLVQFVVPAAVFIAGAWPLWKYRAYRPRRRFAIAAAMLLCAAVVPVVVEGRVEAAEAKLDPKITPNLPCVVTVRDVVTVKVRPYHYEVLVTLDLSNTMQDDLAVEGADFGDWRVSGDSVVPAHGSAEVRMRRELGGGDADSPIHAWVVVRWDGVRGRLYMPPTPLTLDPALRKSLSDGTVDWHSIYDP